jgi:hypothetical protein
MVLPMELQKFQVGINSRRSTRSKRDVATNQVQVPDTRASSRFQDIFRYTASDLSLVASFMAVVAKYSDVCSVVGT